MSARDALVEVNSHTEEGPRKVHTRDLASLMSHRRILVLLTKAATRKALADRPLATICQTRDSRMRKLTLADTTMATAPLSIGRAAGDWCPHSSWSTSNKPGCRMRGMECDVMLLRSIAAVSNSPIITLAWFTPEAWRFAKEGGASMRLVVMVAS